MRVLDVGCGRGGDLGKWKDAGAGHVHCVDPDEQSLIGPNGRPLSTSLTVIGTEPAWQHVLILMAMSIGLVGLSVVVLKSREFSSSAESET